jgi:hypothetical protein
MLWGKWGVCVGGGGEIGGNGDGGGGGEFWNTDSHRPIFGGGLGRRGRRAAGGRRTCRGHRPRDSSDAADGGHTEHAGQHACTSRSQEAAGPPRDRRQGQGGLSQPLGQPKVRSSIRWGNLCPSHASHHAVRGDERSTSAPQRSCQIRSQQLASSDLRFRCVPQPTRAHTTSGQRERKRDACAVPQPGRGTRFTPQNVFGWAGHQ